MLGSLLLKGWAVETAGKTDKWAVKTGRERSEDKVQDKVYRQRRTNQPQEKPDRQKLTPSGY
jgi:hypothetical protein